MNRHSAIARLRSERFDVLVIGGGATGLGCAVDAAARGYRTGLIEANDFAKATSSRSTKLVHGGVRYLEQGNIALVREALLERTRLRANAPELVRELSFVVPAYSYGALARYWIGLKAYDALARGSPFSGSRMLSPRKALSALPTLKHDRLRGAVRYADAQFDDALLAIALARTASDLGAAVANYARAESFVYSDGRIGGVNAVDIETGARFAIAARAVINSTGIFADTLRRVDEPAATPLLTYSRGSHVVLPASSLGSHDAALLVPRTADGRVLFAIPWMGHTLAGTTDIAASAPELEPRATDDEIEYILATLTEYLRAPVLRSAVLSAWAGLRPLIKRTSAQTAQLSREHAIAVSAGGLVTITGGKWTTYRKMAQDAVDTAAQHAKLRSSPCVTMNLRLKSPDRPAVASLNEFARHTACEEMARTVEDVLARRTRMLFVNAEEARTQCRKAAAGLASALNRDEAWQAEQVRDFEQLAKQYGAH